MNIIDDIVAAQRDYTMRMGFRDADFVIIPFDAVAELEQTISFHIKTYDDMPAGPTFEVAMMRGDVRVNGVPVYIGAKLGAGAYTGG
jgi:hypothetical protein